jgi:hypothetical protein
VSLGGAFPRRRHAGVFASSRRVTLQYKVLVQGPLIAFPAAVFVAGSATLRSRWSADGELQQAAHHPWAAIRAHLATLLVAAATLTAAGVLAIVALHVLTD